MSVEHPIHIYVASREALDEKLEFAVKQLQAKAKNARTHGILVTRHRPGAYTARLSAEVPFGITLNRLAG